MNKNIFWSGIALVLMAAVILLFVREETSVPMILGILGIVAIGASGYRPMAQAKKKRK